MLADKKMFRIVEQGLIDKGVIPKFEAEQGPIRGHMMIIETQISEEPEREWIEFFIQTLVKNIQPDGSFGVPMYTFICDVGDFTVVPTLDKD